MVLIFLKLRVNVSEEESLTWSYTQLMLLATSGQTEVKQSTRDNYKVYSSGSHSSKYMEMERRKLIYRVDYDEATTYPTTPSDASRPP